MGFDFFILSVNCFFLFIIIVVFIKFIDNWFVVSDSKFDSKIIRFIRILKFRIKLLGLLGY